MPQRVSGPPPSMQPGAALLSLAARFCWQGQHFRLWTVPERVSGPPPSMLPGAALLSLAARFCWQGQHFRLWTVPERVSGPPPLDAARRSTFEPRGSFLLAGTALLSLAARFCWQALTFEPRGFVSLAARFCWQGQHFRLWTVPERVSAPPPLDAARRSTSEPRSSFLLAGAALQALDGARARFGPPPGAALLSLAARFCWQGQHFRLWTVPERVLPGAALLSLAARFCWQALTFEPRGFVSLAARFCWQGQHFRLWTVPERVSAPPPLDAARRSTSEPRSSFLLAGAALQALDGARARFGPPPGAALLSLAARFCWQGQHFRLWTVPERVSGPPPWMPPGAALGSLAARFCWRGCRARFGAPPCQAQRPGASRLVSAGRGSTSGSGRCPSAFRGPRHPFRGVHHMEKPLPRLESARGVPALKGC